MKQQQYIKILIYSGILWCILLLGSCARKSENPSTGKFRVNNIQSTDMQCMYTLESIGGNVAYALSTIFIKDTCNKFSIGDTVYISKTQ